MMKIIFSSAFFLSLITILPVPQLCAQASSAEIYKDISKFGVLANVLYVAAHPDDENTRLISYFSNHLNARTTYLSMTRGDGGQNLIGPEIREMLGMIRTHELLGAREIDGGHQMFTRANDFGYSKSARETFNIWNRNEVLSDVVWAIRKIQPDIIINRFNTDTIRPNHGHHTASAILSAEAFRLANDPRAFPEQLKWVSTWQPSRIFMNTTWWFYGSRENFDKADKSKMIVIDIGAFDEITGASNSEIAGRSRSMHKSQGFGSAETRGESPDYLDLIEDAKGIIPKDVFEGIDITWNRIKGGHVIAAKAEELKKNFDFTVPSRSVPLLLEIHKLISNLPESNWKPIKLRECESLIKDCLGLFAEARTNTFRASPGSQIPVTLELINRSRVNVSISEVSFTDQENTFRYDTVLSFNKVFLKELTVTVPDDLSVPYWLEETPGEGLYHVADQPLRGIPADEPPLTTDLIFNIEGTKLQYNVPVVYRVIDPAEGEVYRPLSVTPPVAIEFSEQSLVFNKGVERTVNVTLTAYKDSIQGNLEFRTEGPGWKITPSTIPFEIFRAGESIALACIITPPAENSDSYLTPRIHINNDVFHHKITTLDYDHLPYMSVVRDATVPLKSLDIKIIKRPIAYIEGAGDESAQNLEQIGYDVDILDPSEITPAVLDQYQVIILGVRAFNTVEALAYKNRTLFDWVKEGGTLITQYNVNRGLVTNDIAPYSLTLSRDRITEESSMVKILVRDHPALNYPNTIGDADFNDWVQERGLYFPNQWDAQFTPLLEMNDSGESPTKGALLVAPFGDGYYVYSGLSWFRHLPAGVPGAYRLLANLISLGYRNSRS